MMDHFFLDLKTLERKMENIRRKAPQLSAEKNETQRSSSAVEAKSSKLAYLLIFAPPFERAKAVTKKSFLNKKN